MKKQHQKLQSKFQFQDARISVGFQEFGFLFCFVLCILLFPTLSLTSFYSIDWSSSDFIVIYANSLRQAIG